MTPGGYNFNGFPENQLTKFRAVKTALRQNIVHDQGFGELNPRAPTGNVRQSVDRYPPAALAEGSVMLRSEVRGATQTCSANIFFRTFKGAQSPAHNLYVIELKLCNFCRIVYEPIMRMPYAT